jgi:hypothetical protein
VSILTEVDNCCLEKVLGISGGFLLDYNAKEFSQFFQSSSRTLRLQGFWSWFRIVCEENLYRGHFAFGSKARTCGATYFDKADLF